MLRTFSPSTTAPYALIVSFLLMLTDSRNVHFGIVIVLPAFALLTRVWNEPHAAAALSLADGEIALIAATVTAIARIARWRASAERDHELEWANGSWGDAIAPSLREDDRRKFGGRGPGEPVRSGRVLTLPQSADARLLVRAVRGR